jgi:hypothetical protein
MAQNSRVVALLTGFQLHVFLSQQVAASLYLTFRALP